MAAISVKMEQNLADEVESQNTTGRLADMYKRLYDELKEFKATTTVIDDPEDFTAEAETSEQADTQREETPASDKNESDKNASDKDEPCKDEHEEATATLHRIKEHQEQHKAEKTTSEEPLAKEKCPHNSATQGVQPKVHATEFNPAQGEETKVNEIPSLKKRVEALDESYNTMRTAVGTVITVQDNEGNRFTLHPATCHEVEGIDRDGNVTETIGTELILEKDDEQEEEKSS